MMVRRTVVGTSDSKTNMEEDFDTEMNADNEYGVAP